MRFVDNARQFWRWYSTWVVVVSGAMMGAWPLIPAELKTALPEWFVTAYAVATVVAFVGARVVKQDLPKKGGKE